MKITAMVPVRKGSQRVKSKNSKSFSDTSLIDIRLNLLKNVNGLDQIIVSTDCEECTSIAKSHNIEVIARDPYYAGDIPNNEFLKNLAESCPGDAMMYSVVTNPFLRKSTIEKNLNLFRQGGMDSIMSVSLEKKFLWLDGKPINYEATRAPRSQLLPEIVSLNFAMSIIETKKMIEKENLIGDNPLLITLDKIQSIDIDDEEDFMIAETLYEKLGFDWILQ
jgi:CMP-N-acetylneuraminic acid synthetase